MGLRHDILAALAAKHPEVVTLDDLMDATGETNRARLASNLKAAQADALIDRVRDDITNLPAYRLTATGLARHKNGQQQYNGKTQAENVAKGKKTNLEAAVQPMQDAVRDGLLNVIADIRSALGDNTGKIMIGDLAGAVKTLAGALDAAIAERDKYAKRAHDLGNDAAGANLILHAIRAKLGADEDTSLLDALDAALGLAAESPPPAGRLALLLIDSADMIDIETLDTTDLDRAQAEARRNIDVGNAARALVIGIHGEAYRRTEWKAAA